LEQREKGDLEGKGRPHGGRFPDRDGLQGDTLAFAALPAAIQSYLSVTYAGDTLGKAFINFDSSYVVLSKNNGVFANLFTSAGDFIKRIQLPYRPGTCQAIEQAALPAAIPSYLNTTYPDYVVKRAFVVTANGANPAYIVFIDANNTKYAIEFDAAGNYVLTKTIY
jgi:hypothetical protein